MSKPMRRDENRLSGAWRISERRGDTLIDDIGIFLADLCKGHGFCAALPDDIVAAGNPLTAEAFAHAVLHAEGWNDPSDEDTFRPQLMKLFAERYGFSVSVSNSGL
jgi:hypothetical protein